MRDGVRLLRAAAERLDAGDLGLPSPTGFAGGAAWMGRAIAGVRGGAVPEAAVPEAHVPKTGRAWTRHGILKYGLCAAAARPRLVAAALLRAWWPVVPALAAFYAVEAQMVFLFPAALDGHPRPFARSRELVRRSGGTLRVVGDVLPIAGFMLVGGLLGRGVVRAWTTGCLAVVLWYERLRGAA